MVSRCILDFKRSRNQRQGFEFLREVEFMRWFPVAFLTHGVFIVTRAVSFYCDTCRNGVFIVTRAETRGRALSFLREVEFMRWFPVAYSISSVAETRDRALGF